MSQEMMLFKNGNANLPAYLQGHTSDVTASLKGAGVEGNRISIRGRVWRLIQDGEEVAASAAPEMDLIIVAALPDVSRTYFASDYVEGENAQPACWSSDGVTPDVGVGAPQSTACASCPMNEPGSGNRDQSRACRHSKRIAVALPSDPTRAYLMQIPATSLFGDKVPDDAPKSLQQYGRYLAARNADITTLLTRFQFDISSTQPTIRFSAQRYLTQEEFAGACALMRAPETLAMLPLQYKSEAPKAPAKAIPGTPPVANGFGAAAPAQEPTVAAQPTPQAAAPAVDAGFGTTATPQAAAPVAQTPQAVATEPTAQPQTTAGFGAPAGDAGFGAPTKAAEPTATATAAAAPAEPTVVTANQAATTAGVDQGSVADLLNKWGAK